MSNNLVSQPLSIPSKQMDPISDKLDVPIPNMRMGMMDGMPNSPTPQQFAISNKQMGLVEPLSNNFGLHNSPVLRRQMGQMERQMSNLGPQQFLIPDQQVGDMEAMLNNLGSQKISLPSKRRAMEEPTLSNSMGHQLSMPNKNVVFMESFTNHPGLQQLPSPNKRNMQVLSKSGTPGSQNLPALNKKMVRNESISGRSGTKQLQTPKNRTTQMEPSPKVKTESFESVRSKMRESLASALALVTQHQDKPSNTESNPKNEIAMTLQHTKGDSQLAESTSVASADHVSEKPSDSLPSTEFCLGDKANNIQGTTQGIFTDESMEDSAQEVQSNTVLPSEDVPFGDSFFVKDELLQGNGLTWALDLDMDTGETKEAQIAKKPKLSNEDMSGEEIEQALQSPQNLAFKIEVELFKLFGGVNKKYKERGRSLLFNLKDHSNPELRERVMSGEIPPERLCSMTPEELASKELSQWRLAKAEELAQMVVLPDSDVDIRRLVKKTHKGEFQVEFEQDDGVSVEVSVGTSSLTRVQSKNQDTEVHPPAKVDEIKERGKVVGEKSSSENQDLSYSLTIPNDGTDLMQGLMVDEFKDAEFLPPIVSLDEFMESLDSEPPFENLPVDGEKTVSPSDKESTQGGCEVTPSDLASTEPVNATPEKSDKVVTPEKTDKVDVKERDSDVKSKTRVSPIEPKSSPGTAFKGDHVWEGVLQLNVSTLVAVVGFFKSGEKTSTKDWPGSLEIKGRVRLDNFEKFVQALPMSRSRAVMIIHFVLKEESSENDHANLREVVESYVSDERLGFAEPSSGVELYLCPTHPRILEMLSKQLPKDHTEFLNSIDNGLIGIIVWRKAHLSSTMSPNSSSHHKHGSKRHQPFTSRRHQEKDTHTNVNFASKPNPPTRLPPQSSIDDDDDDIPPGFGPGAARDEDDLPEFNFSGGAASNPSFPNEFNFSGGAASNPSFPKPSNQTSSHGPSFRPSSRPVDQMRELVQKYGQTGSNIVSRNNVGVGIQTWNDDDDDIPEWQPQAPQVPVPPRLQIASPLGVLLQPPVNNIGAPAWQQGGRWVQPPGPHHGLPQPSNLVSQPGVGQYYGMPGLRPGQSGTVPRSSRGF